MELEVEVIGHPSACRPRTGDRGRVHITNLRTQRRLTQSRVTSFHPRAAAIGRRAPRSDPVCRAVANDKAPISSDETGSVQTTLGYVCDMNKKLYARSSKRLASVCLFHVRTFISSPDTQNHSPAEAAAVRLSHRDVY